MTSIKQLITLMFLLGGIKSSIIAQQTLAQKLGYAPDAKLLIIHADDLGVAHKNNNMKLRCTTNSIRIRIRKSELQQLAQNHLIEENIGFNPHTTLVFALSIQADAPSIIATLENNYLLVVLPTSIASDWIQTNQVGIETNIPNSDNTTLHILIEKDFPCTDRVNENKADTFWELANEKGDSC